MADSRIEQVKRLTIIALVSDDTLMDQLVLKGGNAIRFTQQFPVRQSMDLDFSIEGDLGPIGPAEEKIRRLLEETFKPHDLTVMDVQLRHAPANVREDVLGAFWGGYKLDFKVIQTGDFERLADRPEKRAVEALPLGPGDKRAFTVDISKHEHCQGKVPIDMDGFTVYVYSPLMIVCEKVRAICQQMPEYRKIVKSSSARPRARDFLDVFLLASAQDLDLRSDVAWTTLCHVFEVKRVPLRLIGEIDQHRDFHRDNFLAVRNTVDASYRLMEFDFYVDFLLQLLAPLQPRWVEDSPRG